MRCTPSGHPRGHRFNRLSPLRPDFAWTNARETGVCHAGLHVSTNVNHRGQECRFPASVPLTAEQTVCIIAEAS